MVFVSRNTLDEKIAAILLSDVAVHICKMQFHWSIQMEWPGSNQSALTTHHILYLSLYFLDSSLAETEEDIPLLIPVFNDNFPDFSDN